MAAATQRRIHRNTCSGGAIGLCDDDLVRDRIAPTQPDARTACTFERPSARDGGALEVMPSLAGVDRRDLATRPEDRDGQTRGSRRRNPDPRAFGAGGPGVPPERGSIQDQPPGDLLGAAVAGEVDALSPARDEARQFGAGPRRRSRGRPSSARPAARIASRDWDASGSTWNGCCLSFHVERDQSRLSRCDCDS